MDESCEKYGSLWRKKRRDETWDGARGENESLKCLLAVFSLKFLLFIMMM
jgi:hypothetical protein